MNAERHGFWNPKRPIAAPSSVALRRLNYDHAGLPLEDADDRIAGQPPQLGNLINGEMVFKGDGKRY